MNEYINNRSETKKIYKKIQQRLFNMIPEKWRSIHLYASIDEKIKGIESGEMFFYYYPKGVIRKKPVSVYEIANKFNIDEEDYSILINKLYREIKRLREEFIIYNGKVWKSITIKIENNKFIIEYYYTDYLEKNYSNEQLHLIWKYKNMEYDLEKLSRKDKLLLKQYMEDEHLEEKEIYEENVYQKQISKPITYKQKTAVTKYKRKEIESTADTKQEDRKNIRKTEKIEKLNNKKNESKKKKKIDKEESETKKVNQLLKL